MSSLGNVILGEVDLNIVWIADLDAVGRIKYSFGIYSVDLLAHDDRNVLEEPQF